MSFITAQIVRPGLLSLLSPDYRTADDADSWRNPGPTPCVAYTLRHSSLTPPPPPPPSSPERPRDRDTEKAVMRAMDELGYRDEVRCGCGYVTRT